jgi:coenzyme F420-0:L-glutamate ligase / coenzyme F420-1:gamma-L-glutamate ligase
LPVSKLEVIPISIPSEIKPNDNLIDIILSSLHKSDSLGIKIKNKDILVIAQKIISKQEGMFVELARVIPSKQALEIKKSVDKDPRLIELILQESRKIIKIFNKTMIVETNQGFICANAGIDQSNVSKNQDRVLLLPRNPDQTASRIRREIKRKTGKEIAVIISDTFGRPFRNGQTNVAIGVSGVKPIKSYIGKKDMYGNVLKVTEIAIADEIAGASELVMGKSNKIPAVIIRGFNFTIARKSNIKDLNRREKLDMFRR